MTGTKIEEARVVQYQLEVQIDAPPPRVWRALTDQLTTWWLPDFHVLGEDSIVTLEATAGGKLIEERGEQSLLWYTVLAVAPNESLSLSGFCTPDWGGPCSTLLTVKLAEDGDGTRVTIADALYGLVSDKQAKSLSSGWQSLFSDGLKRFVETS